MLYWSSGLKIKEKTFSISVFEEKKRDLNISRHCSNFLALTEFFTLLQWLHCLVSTAALQRAADITCTLIQSLSMTLSSLFWFIQDAGEKVKDDPMDLRLDIERRKKYSTHHKNYNQDQGKDAGNSSDCERGRSEENLSKHCKIPKYVQRTDTKCFDLSSQKLFTFKVLSYLLYKFTFPFLEKITRNAPAPVHPPLRRLPILKKMNAYLMKVLRWRMTSLTRPSLIKGNHQ